MEDGIDRTLTPARIFLLAGSILLVIGLLDLLYFLIDIISAGGGLDTIASHYTDVLADDLLFKFLLGGTLHSLWRAGLEAW